MLLETLPRWERLLRVGFDSHLTNFGHTCWMQKGRQQTTIKEERPTSEAPLYSLDVEVLPPLGALGDGKSTVGARVAPIAAAECEQLEEGSKVEMAGLVQDLGLNGQKGICLGRATDVERWLVALLGGRRANVNMSIVKTSGDLDAEVVQREATLGIPLKGPDDPPSRAMIEAHTLTHVVYETCFVGTMSEGAWWREDTSPGSLHHLSSAAILSSSRGLS